MSMIDLNADLGEGGSQDEALLRLVSSANIACGGHAGDEATMRRAIELAMAAGVRIGAHPGYEDREHFGRRAMTLPLAAVTLLVRRQVERLSNLAREMGAFVHHVKAHGSLYNQADRDRQLADAVVTGVASVSADLVLYGPPSGALAAAARAAGITLCAEGFADRRYLENGLLMPRAEPGAVISNVEEAVAQAMALVAAGEVKTLCVHGDGVTAVEILRVLRGRLEEAGLQVGSQSC
jgi:5-oxoprolinase (ATP-hydrolysing) subunit A